VLKPGSQQYEKFDDQLALTKAATYLSVAFCATTTNEIVCHLMSKNWLN
jgi:hypothetical protein